MTKLQLNSIGCKAPNCRSKYIEELKNFYMGKERSLCPDCQRRVANNPLRLLDCKQEDCIILAKMAPKLQDALCKECVEFDTELKQLLHELGLEFFENPSLVRGLDYYTKTVFEFWDRETGAQNAIGGGGRYDGLIELLGGQPTPAVGYAAGMERIVENMKNLGVKVPKKDDLHVFVAQLGFEAKKKCLTLIQEMRNSGLRTLGALGKGSMKDQLKMADKFAVPYTVIIGLTEVRDGTAILRDMQVGKQETIAVKDVIPKLKKLIGAKHLDIYSPGELLY